MVGSLEQERLQRNAEAIISVSSAERNSVVADQSAPCVHALFEAQVERTPEALAVACAGQTLTYRELNSRANRLAHYLRSRGAGPNVLVGLCVERSLEMVVGILGILKAGSAYVPLDPTYPPQRLAQMLEDAQAPLVVTQQPLKTTLPLRAAEAVCLDAEWAYIGQQPEYNPTSGVEADNIVYVIYTSGSTGKPKGTAVSHQGFANLVQWFVGEFGFGSTDRTLLLTSISFDLTQKNLYAVLSVGGQLHLAPGGLYDPQIIAEAVCDSQTTHLNCTPSHFYSLVAEVSEANYQKLASLRYVYLGGEPIDLALLAPWRAHRLCHAQLVNTYGPTECADIAAFYILPPNFPAEEQALPIGGPIPNVMLYVLDEHHSPVPAGVSGELSIGGVGVGPGYIGRPDLTAEKFIPDPFSSVPGARLYRTGDLVRSLKSGDLQFLGRIDHQVKIRGMRIELGEIESILAQYPGIRQAVVLGREDVPGEKRLVAYIVGAEGAISRRALREHLLVKLPDYMVPAVFVFLETFPLSPNGKIDRKALPVPDSSLYRERPPVAPRDGLETQLVQLWENTLGLAPIGIEDDFFEIGGHSLLAGRLFAAIAQTLGKDLPLISLLEAPTISQQAEMLRGTQTSENWRSLVRIKPGGSRPPIFGIHGGQGTVLFYRQLSHHLHPDQPLFGLQQQGLNGRRTALTHIEDMAAHYIQEIQTIQPQGPYYLIGYCFGGTVAFEMARQMARQGEQISLLGMINAPSPDYDWSKEVPIPPDTLDATASAAKDAARPTRLMGNRFWRRVQSGLGRRYRLLRQKTIVRLRSYVPLVALSIGATIPLEFRRAYTSNINERALLRYTPDCYPGRMLVIRGSGLFRDPTTGWDGRALEGLELHEVAGRHRLYGDIMTEPYIRGLAEILDNAMASAQFEDTPKELTA